MTEEPKLLTELNPLRYRSSDVSSWSKAWRKAAWARRSNSWEPTVDGQSMLTSTSSSISAISQRSTMRSTISSSSFRTALSTLESLLLQRSMSRLTTSSPLLSATSLRSERHSVISTSSFETAVSSLNNISMENTPPLGAPVLDIHNDRFSRVEWQARSASFPFMRATDARIQWHAHSVRILDTRWQTQISNVLYNFRNSFQRQYHFIALLR
jgi:hypothetical protein